MRMRRLLAVPAVAILFLAACGDDDDDGGGQAERQRVTAEASKPRTPAR